MSKSKKQAGQDSSNVVEIITPANPMQDAEAAKALLPAVNDELSKRTDAMDSFLSEINKAQAADIRRETKAFISDLRDASGKVASAIVHLHNVKTILDNDAQFSSYSKALVAEGYVTAGTLYTLTKKIEVFEQLAIAEPARKAIMAYSNGDSVIVRRAMKDNEIAEFKSNNPGTKPPKGIYEASKYFTRAVEVVDVPQRWTPDSADTYAGRVLRLAAKLRGKDRTGAVTDGKAGDSRKIARFEDTLDKLEVMLVGKAIDGKITGMITLSDATRQNELFSDAVQTIVESVCKRLPLSALDTLYERVDILFKKNVQTLQELETKTKTARAKAS